MLRVWRGLNNAAAAQEAEEPFTVRLTFEHKTGDQDRGEEGFYTAAKSNACVACGAESNFLRYRVVPNCYRRALPVCMKSHRSHDVVLLCWACHETASQAAERLKGQLSVEFGVPLLPPLPSGSAAAPGAGPGSGGSEDEDAAAASSSGSQAGPLHPCNVRRAAMALERYGGEMPHHRRRCVARERAGLHGDLPCHLVNATAAVVVWQQASPPLACRELEVAILRYIGEEEEQPLGAGHLSHGLLAGLGPSSRRRTLRRWLEQGVPLPPDLAEEAAAAAAALAALAAGTGAAQPAPEAASAAAAEGGPGPSAGPASSEGGQRGLQGQLWHGQRVMDAAMAAGGDAAVHELCARFRRGFVAALRPRHLPPGWQVEHAAPREFGAHSVYAAHGGEGQAG